MRVTEQTVKARRSAGKALRKIVPRSSHADWEPAVDRSDPVALLDSQNADRLPWLVPVRHARMMVTPFTFYRGAAKVMAADLATTPTVDQTVQLCGDAHLLNFGMYASPERSLVFDANDFDETLPGPWEWDVKRLAASFTIAGRDNEFDRDECRAVTAESVRAYREAMADFAQMRYVDVWYTQLTVEHIARVLAQRGKLKKKRTRKQVAKVRSKDSLQALGKLAERVNGEYRIKNDPPLLTPLRELASSQGPDELRAATMASFEAYRETLPSDRRVLLDRYRPIDVAIKVVGVGSAGTRCFTMLLEGRDDGDPLFLQTKEATASVLEDHLSRSQFRKHGRRVVEGQRLMQAASDIFLGWEHSGTGFHYYWRQLRDWKGSVDLERFDPVQMSAYAGLCGWTLARAHARSGDAAAIAGYLGRGAVFDEALAAFAQAYADQNEADHAAFVEAIDSGRLEAGEQD